MPSQTSTQYDPVFRKLFFSRVLTRLSIYFIIFGIIMLLMGGLRSLLFPQNMPSKILVAVGILTLAMGTLYMCVAIAIIRTIRDRISPSSLWVMTLSSRPNYRGEEITSVSRHVPFPAPGQDHHQQHQCYSNPMMRSEDPKEWEPPPSYESAVASSPRPVSSV